MLVADATSEKRWFQGDTRDTARAIDESAAGLQPLHPPCSPSGTCSTPPCSGLRPPRRACPGARCCDGPGPTGECAPWTGVGSRPALGRREVVFRHRYNGTERKGERPHPAARRNKTVLTNGFNGFIYKSIPCIDSKQMNNNLRFIILPLCMFTYLM